MASQATTHSPPRPLTVRCQCGSVSFPTPTATYLDLFHCHCTECQKQSSSAYGTSAIYPAEGLFPLSPALEAKLKVYTRPTSSGGTMHCWFCPECGSRLVHRVYEKDGTPRSTVSVKGGCVEGLNWEGAKHIYVRSAVIEIPVEWEQYYTGPVDINRGEVRNFGNL
ncbi:Mss4-like protein [Pseudomassariella vexata]|uniref:Mss4-like protein n=1 Tax=Pseudomassariella vexata TaxID=1141098 RepID=A0A1Y2E6W1_9PEZI|nr:Mss4-like protein [Pseudomassariella vexata]ORY67177.1 Mss4-like protein [Pseudomassariella vexata]